MARGGGGSGGGGYFCNFTVLRPQPFRVIKI